MKSFISKIQEQFALMAATGMLFVVNVSGRDVYNAYLNAFEDGTDPIFRDPSSSTHNCNHCQNFIRRYGNVVAIDSDGNVITMFGAAGIDAPYAVVASALDAKLKAAKIKDVFFETFAELQSLPYEQCKKTNGVFRLGIDKNHKRYTRAEAELYGVVKANEVRTFDHINVDVPNAFVDTSGKSQEAIQAQYRDKYSVFRRACEELNIDTLNLVRDLINQGSLLDGTAHLHAIEEMIGFMETYNQCKENGNIDNWFWSITYNMDERVAKFKNTLMGVLCTELAEGKELNEACLAWNKRVDPANYHKASAPITDRQIKEAEKFVMENGYIESFQRRCAELRDISASEIKHISSSSEVKNVSIFDGVKSTSTRHKRAQFDGVEEIPIEKFMSDILPTVDGVEVFLQNNHEGNLVTLTTPAVKDSKPIFKWDNNYSWNFNGNLAGKSQIKEAVKSHGGKVDGVLRFSMMWAEGDPSDNSDLDAWCQEPGGRKIGYSQKRSGVTGGNLDVDITRPNGIDNQNVVENITWPELNRMPDGEYKFWVNPYAIRGSKGFDAEIEVDGEVHQYTFPRRVTKNVPVASVIKKGASFEVKHELESASVSKELWGLETNQFHKVNLVCLSPNHWGENAVGNKHYFFMMDGCKTTSKIRGFHNENLNSDLLTHRKVMEVLGATTMIEPSDEQLSGVGFNSTVRDEVIVKLLGSHQRVVKLKF